MAINLKYLDMTGNSPDSAKYLLNRTYLHTRTEKRYAVVGFTWIGDLDMWGVLHKEVGEHDLEGLFVRSIANFKGKHLDGVNRFCDAQVFTQEEREKYGT
jgi:hypothetical protein